MVKLSDQQKAVDVAFEMIIKYAITEKLTISGAVITHDERSNTTNIRNINLIRGQPPPFNKPNM